MIVRQSLSVLRVRRACHARRWFAVGRVGGGGGGGEEKEEEHAMSGRRVVREGRVQLTLGGSGSGDGDGAFFNDCQSFNRNLSIAVIAATIAANRKASLLHAPPRVQQYGNAKVEAAAARDAAAAAHASLVDTTQPIRILDAFSGSSIRALRYAKEIPL